MVEMRDCTQKRCAYQESDGCRYCEECEAKTLVINTSCVRCLRCECVPDALRWGDSIIPENKITTTIKEEKQEEILEKEQEIILTINKTK